MVNTTYCTPTSASQHYLAVYYTGSLYAWHCGWISVVMELVPAGVTVQQTD